jgi:hypothetical protein
MGALSSTRAHWGPRTRSPATEGRPCLADAAHNGNRYRFLPNAKELVVVQAPPGTRISGCSIETATTPADGSAPRFEMKSFDISPDGKQTFDRYRENSDVADDLVRR